MINEGDYENEVEETIDPEWNEEDDESKALRKEFSLDYMIRAIKFYDEIGMSQYQHGIGVLVLVLVLA